jgi:hypothetical protein
MEGLNQVLLQAHKENSTKENQKHLVQVSIELEVYQKLNKQVLLNLVSRKLIDFTFDKNFNMNMIFLRAIKSYSKINMKIKLCQTSVKI